MSLLLPSPFKAMTLSKWDELEAKRYGSSPDTTPVYGQSSNVKNVKKYEGK